MSTTAKCIGGPRDGVMIVFPDEQKYVGFPVLNPGFVPYMPYPGGDNTAGEATYQIAVYVKVGRSLVFVEMAGAGWCPPEDGK